MIISRASRLLTFVFLLAFGRATYASDALIEYCHRGFGHLAVRVPIQALRYIKDHLLPRVEELEKRLGPGGIYAAKMNDRELAGVVQEYRQLMRDAENHQGAEQFRHMGDAELKAEAEKEMGEIEARLLRDMRPFRDRIINLLDPAPEKLVLEIDSAGGGPDAEQWVSQLNALYEKMGKDKGWKMEVLQTDHGATHPRKVSVSVEGKGAWEFFRHEIGAHRIQSMSKVKDRIFTDKIVVAVSPQVKESEFRIPDSDLDITTTTSQGPGGQSVNKTQSAVRIKHIPSGITVVSQDQRSQAMNKASGLVLLRQKLKQKQDEEKLKADRQAKRAQIGTGRREEAPRIRSYNLATGEVNDHRINQGYHGRLSSLADVDLSSFQEGLQDAYLDDLIRRNTPSPN